MTIDIEPFSYLIPLAIIAGYAAWEIWHRLHGRGVKYFISFQFSNLKRESDGSTKKVEGFGSATVEVVSKIDSHEKIVALESRIKEEEDFDEARIIFWRRYE